MPDAERFRIMTDANCKSFLQIEKTPSGSYIIRFFPQSITYDFISIVVEMLQKYGDVFAAYVNTMDPNLPLVENKALITIFPTTIEETNILIAKTGKFYSDPDWKSSEVNYLESISKFTEYDGHLYLFTKKYTKDTEADLKSKVELESLDDDYEAKSLRQLKEIAKNRKVYGYALMKRPEIIKALQESE